MMPTRSELDKLIELRRAAERLAQEKPVPAASVVSLVAPAQVSTEELIHELHVHQIELEMQNEQLRLAQFDLEETRQRYFDLYDLAPVGYLVLNAAGAILEANLTASGLLGTDRQSLINYPFPLFIQNAQLNLFTQAFKKLAESGEQQSCEVALRRRDGQPLWVRVEMSDSLHESAGQACNLVLVDVTEKMRAETSLKESQQNLLAMFDTMTEGIALNEIVRDENGEMIDYRILKVNKAFYTTADYHTKQVLGGLASQVYGMPREIISAFWREHRQKQSTAFTEMLSPINQRWFFVATSPFMDNRFVTTFLDITARKQAETLALASSAGLARAQHFAHVGSWEWHIQTGELEGSDEMYAIFGLKKAGFSGRLADVMATSIHPADREAVEASNLSVMEKGISAPLEYRVIRPDGSQRVVWAEAGELVRDELGQPATLFGIVQDITERKQAEAELEEYRIHLEELVGQRTAELEIAKNQAEAANRAKGEFLAVMSHEIRTPLNGLLGSAQLLEQTDLNDKQRNFLSNMVSSGDALLAVINDILDFSRLESGKVALEETAFNLDEELARLAGGLSHQAWQKNLELVLDVAPETPRRLVGDPARLLKVLMNLAGNAVKFTQSGSVNVQVLPLEHAPGQARLAFAVQDTGIGLSQAQIGQLFQPFTQADSSTNRKYGGSGLGLSISQGLVRIMGGEIEVESQPGVGSLFHFDLPFGLQPGEESPAQPAIPELAGQPVLVVDDNPLARAAISRSLESLGCRVTATQSPDAALHLLGQTEAQQPFALLLIDWNLRADQNGLEVLRAMRQAWPQRQIPAILMVSADEIIQFEDDQLVDGYIIKPFLGRQLAETIRRVLDEKVHHRLGTGPLIARPAVPINQALLSIAEKKLRGAQVLLVEDNQINQAVAREMLELMNMQVWVAESGEQALEMVRGQVFDVILMDIQMPGMDGYETTARIRREPGQCAPAVPIIAMTANALEGDRGRALQAGLDDYISKPVSLQRLSSTLAKWLQTSAAETEPAIIPQPMRDPAAGLDSATALARLGGNRALYLKLLRIFEQEHAADVDRLRAALQAPDLKPARLLVHSLKGVAATLGASDLRAAARDLEMVMAGESSLGSEAALAALDEKMAALLGVISGMV